MKPLKIGCADKDLKLLLKKNLQEGAEVIVENFYYTEEGQFCEMLALSHSMDFRLEVRSKTGHFTNRPAAIGK